MYITLLILGAHVQEGYGNLSVCVCRSVCLSGLFSETVGLYLAAKVHV